MDAIAFRAIERILVVIVGGFIVYLGYALFLHIPDQQDSRGKVVLPGGISIFLTRIGPGAFFALFGAIVVAMSFRYSIKYSEAGSQALERSPTAANTLAGPVPGNSKQKGRVYEGMSSGIEDMQLQSDMYFVNAVLPTLLKPKIAPGRRSDLQAVLPRLKLGELHLAWRSEWGDFKVFQAWVEDGEKPPAPSEVEYPARLYTYGQASARRNSP